MTSRQDGIYSKLTQVKCSQHCRREVSGFVHSEARQPVGMAAVVVLMAMVMVMGAITGVLYFICYYFL